MEVFIIRMLLKLDHRNRNYPSWTPSQDHTGICNSILVKINFPLSVASANAERGGHISCYPLGAVHR